MACPDVNIFQLMEELLESILNEMDLKYIPHYANSKKSSGIISPAITNSIISVGKDIFEPYERHIEDVLYILLTGKCKVYVSSLGDYVFFRKEFSWGLFRAFLTFICVLFATSFKKRDVHLSDELIIRSATYMERNLSGYIGNIEAWRAFEQNCVKTSLRMEQQNLQKKLEHSTLMLTEKPKKVVSMEEIISDFAQASLEKQPRSKPHFAQAKETACNTTTDLHSFERDFTFAKSVCDRNAAAGSSNQYKNKYYSGLLITDNPVDSYDFRMQEINVVSDADLIVHVVHSSIKALNEI